MSTKQEILANLASSFNKAGADEVLFVLRAKDPIGAQTVRHWVDHAHAAGHEAEKIMEASICADDMDTWRNNEQALNEALNEAVKDQNRLSELEGTLKLCSGKVLFSDGEFRFIGDEKPVVARSLRGLIEKMPNDDDIPF